MIPNTIAEKLKRQSTDDFKGRHFEAWLIVQAVVRGKRPRPRFWKILQFPHIGIGPDDEIEALDPLHRNLIVRR